MDVRTRQLQAGVVSDRGQTLGLAAGCQREQGCAGHQKCQGYMGYQGWYVWSGLWGLSPNSSNERTSCADCYSV